MAAERDRLLYVAATRARNELLVARYDVPAESPWGAFHEYLEGGHEALILPQLDAPEPARLTRSASDISAETEQVRAHRQSLSAPGWRADAVTRRVKPSAVTVEAAGSGVTQVEFGMTWGKIVHSLLELAAQGVSPETLRQAAESAFRGEDVPAEWHDDRAKIDEAVETVARVIRTDVWRQAQAARTMLAEVPFAVAWPAEDYRKLVASIPGARALAPIEIVEGVIDLLFREGEAWTLVDYKTDREGADMDPDRRAGYKAQLDLYAACWTRITGEAVKERILLFLADETAVRW
jgi:ATP-dependent helicase/nuclease subunit A